MISEVRKRYNFSIYVLIYLAFIFDVVICDYVHYLTKINYNIVLAVTSLAVMLMTGLYIKKTGIVKTEYNQMDFAAVFLIILVCVWRGIMPEVGYDTSNYHVYFQAELGRDFINDDFFAIRAVNAHTICLGDRMLGVFRRILGYRMGTMLNTFATIVIYFQLKKVAAVLGRSVHFEISGLAASVISFVCLMTENIYTALASYMVDLLGIPLVLQMFLMVLDTEKEDGYVKGEALWLCTMAGMLCSMKISNLLMIVPLAVLYLVKRWGKLQIKAIIAGFFGAVLMFALYMYISYDLTGNPVFPYLNGIFKSGYFSEELSPNDLSAFNLRFGPNGLLETIFWPIYMVISSAKTSEFYCSGRLLIAGGIAVSFGLAELFRFKKETSVKSWEVSAVLVVYYIIFLFAFRGYMRYTVILELLVSAAALVYICKYFKKKKAGYYLLTIGLCVLFSAQICYSGYKYFVKSNEWAWRDIRDKGRLAANLRKVFRDYGSGVDSAILEDIQTLLVVDSSGSLSLMLAPEARIINLTSSSTNEKTNNMLWERLGEISEEGIYSLQKNEKFIVNEFSNYGFQIIDIMTIQPDFCDAVFSMPLLKLAKNTGIKGAECKTDPSRLEFDLTSEDVKVDVFVGDSPGIGNYNDIGYDVAVSLYDNETGETELIEVVEVARRGLYRHMEITIKPDDGWDKIVVTKESSDERINYVWCTAILQRYE